jgi:hypothetical protein
MDGMLKMHLALAGLFLTVCGMSSAATLYVTGSGTFGGIDTPDTFVTPGDTFALKFVVPTSPTINGSNSTTLSFDVPVIGFSYTLNGSMLSVPAPTEITFYTAADGGGIAVDFGPNTEFLFGSSQIFSGTTATPAFSSGSFASQNFLFLDNNNVDSNSATVTVAPTPEPSSLLFMLCGGIGCFAFSLTSKNTAITHRP